MRAARRTLSFSPVRLPMSSRFLTQFVAFALVCYVVLFGLRQAFGQAVVHPQAPIILGVLLALTLLGYWLTAITVRRSPDRFLVAYFGGVGIRIIIGLIIILTYFLQGGRKETHGLLTFLGVFFIAYFLCSGFELWAIFSNLRPFSAEQSSKDE